MNSFEIITGEKIQEIADIYIGTPSKLMSNPRIRFQYEKHIPISLVPSEFNNPPIIFFYSDEIEMIANIIQYFINPVVLISHNSDQNILETPSSFKILENKKVVKWYSQNVCFYHPKLEIVPIGFANSMWAHGNISVFENPQFIEEIQKNIKDKPNHIFFNFNIHTNRSIRQPCYDSLIKTIPFLPNIHPAENLKRLSKYKFCISPEGNGVDCHRLWEALYLKVVPIVLDSPFIRILLGHKIPLIVLNEWREIEELESKLDYNTYDFSVMESEFRFSKMMDKIKSEKIEM
jgi:hypothetical protein